MTQPTDDDRTVILGRKACPLCGFHAAHVRQAPGRLPHLHCPDCGCRVHTRNGHQARLLQYGMRPEGGAHCTPFIDSDSDAIVIAPAFWPSERRASWLDPLTRASHHERHHQAPKPPDDRR